MLLLNLQNVDEIIFTDSKVRELLRADFRPTFDQWLISQKMPFLRHLRKQARLDLLNGITKDHIKILKDYFGDDVVVERMDTHSVRNVECLICDEKELMEIDGYKEFSISRTGDQMYISFWR